MSNVNKTDEIRKKQKFNTENSKAEVMKGMREKRIVKGTDVERKSERKRERKKTEDGKICVEDK